MLETIALAAALSAAAAGEAPLALDAVVVEAAKAPRETGDVAATVTVIDRARIERELAENIQDLVRYEPGISAGSQGSRFGFDGFTIRGIGADRVRIEVDGVPASPAFAIGDFSNASRDFVDLNLLRQVEIVRGPASALFGSDAIGGVVSFVTVDPADLLGDDDYRLAFGGGHHSHYGAEDVRIETAARRGELSGLLSATYRDFSERDVAGADPLGADSRSVLAKAVYGEIGAGGIELSVDAFREDRLTEVDSLERVRDFSAAFGFPFVLDTSLVRADDERRRTRLGLEQDWTGGLGPLDYLRWRAYWQESVTEQDTVEERTALIAGNASAALRNRRFEFEQDLAGVEAVAGSEVETGALTHSLVYGVQAEWAETAQIRDGIETDPDTGATTPVVGPDTFPVRDFPLSDTREYGLFVQDEIRFGEGRWRAIPGLRWDRYELDPEADAIFREDNPGIEPAAIEDERVSAKLGVLFDVAAQWQLFAQYAEGFRAPPVNDVNVGFTNFRFGYTTLPNPDLEAERSRSLEAGVRWRADRWQVEAVAFRNRYRNFIESLRLVDIDPLTGLLIFQSVNRGSVQILGGELRAALAPAAFPDGLRVELAAAYAEGEDRDTGAYLNSVEPLTAVLALDYSAPSDRLGATLALRAAAGQDKLDRSDFEPLRAAGYGVLDLYGYWRATERLSLRAGVFNLGDREYFDYADVRGIPADAAALDSLVAPGRSFSVSLDWTLL